MTGGLPQMFRHPDGTLDVHATTVAFPAAAADGPPAAALLFGPSGSGKSELALELIALGAVLVADDRTRLVPGPDGRLVASAPDRLRGLIEARGMGILRLPVMDEAPLRVAVDLGRTEAERLPHPRTIEFAGVRLPLLHAVANRSFPAALSLYLRHSCVGSVDA